MAARQRPAEKRGYDILHSIAAVNHGRRQSRQDAALAAEMQVSIYRTARAWLSLQAWPSLKMIAFRISESFHLKNGLAFRCGSRIAAHCNNHMYAVFRVSSATGAVVQEAQSALHRNLLGIRQMLNQSWAVVLVL